MVRMIPMYSCRSQNIHMSALKVCCLPETCLKDTIKITPWKWENPKNQYLGDMKRFHILIYPIKWHRFLGIISSEMIWNLRTDSHFVKVKYLEICVKKISRKIKKVRKTLEIKTCHHFNMNRAFYAYLFNSVSLVKVKVNVWKNKTPVIASIKDLIPFPHVS